MYGKKLWIIAVLVFLCLSSSASCLFAQAQGSEAILAGLTTMNIRIQYYEDGVLQDTSPERAQLQSDAEGMLTDAGLKLVDSGEFERLLSSRNYPVAMLDMEVRMSKLPDTDLRTYLLSLKIRQGAFLGRRPVVTFLASTWESTNFGATKDFSLVRRVAKDALGKFVESFQAQNSK
jgi:hypothetical protein